MLSYVIYMLFHRAHLKNKSQFQINIDNETIVKVESTDLYNYYKSQSTLVISHKLHLK